MKNSILLHDVTPQQLVEQLNEGVKKQLQDLKTELLNKEATMNY